MGLFDILESGTKTPSPSGNFSTKNKIIAGTDTGLGRMIGKKIGGAIGEKVGGEEGRKIGEKVGEGAGLIVER